MNIIENIVGSFKERPGAPTVTYGANVWTGAACFEAVEASALALSNIGAARGSRIAYVTSSRPESLFYMLGGMRAGACICPMNTSLSDAALMAALKNCDPVAIVCDSGSAHRVTMPARETGAALINIDNSPSTSHDNKWKWPEMGPDDPCAIIYSSGTTGIPKGILHSHGVKWTQAVMARSYGFCADTVLISTTPLYSNTTLIGLLPTLAWGGRAVMMENFDAGAFLSLAREKRATHVIMVPVQYERILDHENFKTTDLSAFQLKVSTGAPLAPSRKAALVDDWPGRFIEIYGSTEGAVSTVLDATAHRDKLDTVGRVMPDFDIRVIDEHGCEIEPGEIGELVGRSPTMTEGYFRAPDETKAMLWTAPDGTAFLRSGDLGSIDGEGFVRLHGRKKDVIISGGFNIYAVDLETVLESYPGVREAGVIAAASKRWGETPVAYIAGAEDIDTEQVLAFANERLGKTQRISKIFLCDALPRNALGKVLKQDLREKFHTEFSALT